jgi:membrane-associated phospholipid phosphatase
VNRDSTQESISIMIGDGQRRIGMAISYPVFFAIYLVTIVIGMIVALLITVGWKDMWLKKTLASAKYNIVYLMILAGFPLLIQALDILEIRRLADSPNEVVYTNWIFQLSGEAIKIVQERLNYILLQDFFIVIYVWVFTFITYFCPMLLLVRDDRATLRRYSVAMLLNYSVLLPFYIFFPVAVSGSTAGTGMQPSLYLSTNWGKMVTSVDPLNNNFPSGHVSLMVATFLVFYLAGTAYRRYYFFLGASTLAIVFAVLYLGIHWPPDVFAGFAVGVAAAVVSGSPKVQMTIDRYVRTFTNWILRGKSGNVVGPKAE